LSFWLRWVCGWVNTMSAIANQTRQELTDELLAMLDCGFGATLEIGRKLVGNWCAFALDKPSMLG